MCSAAYKKRSRWPYATTISQAAKKVYLVLKHKDHPWNEKNLILHRRKWQFFAPVILHLNKIHSGKCWPWWSKASIKVCNLKYKLCLDAAISSALFVTCILHTRWIWKWMTSDGKSWLLVNTRKDIQWLSKYYEEIL